MKKGINIIQGKYHNKVPELCDYCNKDEDSIKELEEKYSKLLRDYTKLENQLKTIIGKCSIKNFYNVAQKGEDKKHFKTLAYQNRWRDIPLEDTINYLDNMETKKMITITFDPQFFKHIHHKDSQKKYLVSILELMKEDQVIGDYIGCYELQENGRVHIHAKTQFALPAVYEYRKWLTSKGIENQKAIHVMDKNDIDEYIMKTETKDPDAVYHFFKNNI